MCKKEIEGTAASESIPPQLDTRSRYWASYRVYRHKLPSDIVVCMYFRIVTMQIFKGDEICPLLKGANLGRDFDESRHY